MFLNSAEILSTFAFFAVDKVDKVDRNRQKRQGNRQLFFFNIFIFSVLNVCRLCRLFFGLFSAKNRIFQKKNLKPEFVFLRIVIFNIIINEIFRILIQMEKMPLVGDFIQNFLAQVQVR